MKSIVVNAEHTYEVQIGSDWIAGVSALIANRSRVAIIVSQSFTPDLTALENMDADVHIFKIPDGEAGKSFESLTKLWDWLGAAGFTRSDLIIGIGGGGVTDVAGFVAATWLRGIDWVAVPTSLAGMVDAAIGGKTGINSDYAKNLIGAFHSPICVVIDSNFLKTLSDRDFAAGLAEVIKSGFIKDVKILDRLKDQNISSLRENHDLTIEIITRTIQVKADVVGIDFKESFAREILNYGHTLGHAVEIHSKYLLRHGEAVSIGLVYIAELAHARGLINENELAQHRRLLSAFGLPITYEREAWQYLRPLLALDKKARGSTIRFVALNGLGQTIRLEDLTSVELDAAYERICP
jgi:3-dehydroquinate synthase